ncbi:MAG: hypothetical protein RIM72_06230 [Alphaproteobacteria bacterium]
MLVRKTLGLLVAAVIAAGAVYLYLTFNAQVFMLRGTVIDDLVGIGYLRDLQYVLWAIIVFVVLWAAEKLWDKAAARLWPEQDQ